MTIQAVYRDIELTPDDVIDAHTHGKLETFDVKLRDDNLHVMLYPKQYSNVKIQISRYTANIWVLSFDQLDEIEDLLNETFSDSLNLRPFKERDILLNLGELRKILETPLGLINIFAYYFPSVIAGAAYQAIQCTDNWNARIKPKRKTWRTELKQKSFSKV